MIIGFSRHSTGKGNSAIAYLTDPKRQGREDNPPTVIHGNADQTRRLINSLTFKHTHTSGVLSFAPGENITPKMEQEIIDGFEKLAFAGLDADQYDILWVRHTHANHHELHFITPRVELGTGKSLNIKPPGKKSQDQFDDLRTTFNATYGLADPTDPHRARTVSQPDHELKIASEALRKGLKPSEDMRGLIDAVLSQRASEGLIRSRQDLLSHVKAIGFEIPRAGKTYITVKDPQSNQRWRLKGPLYDEAYSPSRTIKAADAARTRDYSTPDRKTAEHYGQRVARHREKRARYHQSRYGRTQPIARLDIHQASPSLANPDRPEPLNRYLTRQLGNDAVSLKPDHLSQANRLRAERERRKEPSGILQQSVMRPDRPNGPSIRKQLPHSERLLSDDGTRNSLAERLKRFAERVFQTTRIVSERAERFTRDVQTDPTSKRSLEPTARQIKRTAFTIEQRLERQPSQSRRSHLRSPF